LDSYLTDCRRISAYLDGYLTDCRRISAYLDGYLGRCRRISSKSFAPPAARTLKNKAFDRNPAAKAIMEEGEHPHQSCSRRQESAATAVAEIFCGARTKVRGHGSN
jgi:hypothetical protein